MNNDKNKDINIISNLNIRKDPIDLSEDNLNLMPEVETINAIVINKVINLINS